MANRYRYHVKKPHGKLKKLSDTLFANDIKDACYKVLEMVDYKISEETYSYIMSEIEQQTTSEKCGSFKIYHGDGVVETFVEVVNENIFK